MTNLREQQKSSSNIFAL